MKSILNEIIQRVVNGVKPDKIILFGSRATDTSKTDSDYDICIIKHHVKDRRILTQRVYQLLYGIGVAVDVIVETSSRFEDLKTNPYLIYNEIATQGRTIYEKTGAS